MSRHAVSQLSRDNQDDVDPSTRVGRIALISAGAVIIALTAAAFWLSYAHLADVAGTYGLGGSPIRQWAWPATLDLFIVSGELLMLVSALRGKRDPWAIGLTVAGSVGSIGLNVAGVGTDAPLLAYIVAAVPPLAALLAFGALMRQVHVFVSPASLVPGDNATEAVPGDMSPAPDVLDGDTGTEPVPAVPVVPTLVPELVPAVSRQRVSVPAAVSRPRPGVRITLDKTPEQIKAASPVRDTEEVPHVFVRDAKAGVPQDVLGNLTGVVRFLRETGHDEDEIKSIVPTLPGHEGVKADSLKKALARTR